MKNQQKQSGANNRKKILIVDDHPMMREGLAQLIGHEKDLIVCGEAGSAHQALEIIDQTKPDLVLVDISLAGKSGLELIKDIQSAHSGMAILVISMHEESLYAERVLRAGGRGYVMKQEGGKKLMLAMRQVLNGQVYVSDRMSAKILEIFSGRRPQTASLTVELLTDREFEIFQLFGQGKATREVADQLHLSAKTVEVHRVNMKKKLKVKTVPELIRYAVRWVESQSATGL